jgi:hypothetical protein
MAAWRVVGVRGEEAWRSGSGRPGSKANPEKRREEKRAWLSREAVRSVVWAGGRRGEQREGGNVAGLLPGFFHSSSFNPPFSST